MARTLYDTILDAGEARGLAQVLITLLTRQLGALEGEIVKGIRAEANLDTLRVWLYAAIDAPDAATAGRLLSRIRACLSPGEQG